MTDSGFHGNLSDKVSEGNYVECFVVSLYDRSKKNYLLWCMVKLADSSFIRAHNQPADEEQQKVWIR